MARESIKEIVFERFWNRVDKTPGHGPNGDCWLWTGAVSKSIGYGKLSIGDGRTMDAHRFVCAYIHGLDMTGLDAMHSCDVRLCVRPDHLSAGTRKKNSLDCVERGRHARIGTPKKGEANHSAKLTNEQVLRIRELGKTEHKRRIAETFNISLSAVFKILNGQRWKHLQ